MRGLLVVAVLLAQFDDCEVELPGESLESYDVVGVLLENTCGSVAVPAEDPLEFIAEIRVETDSARAYWRRPDAALVSGTELDEVYRFRTNTYVPIYDADPLLGTGFCALNQDETIIVEQREPDDAGGSSDQLTGQSIIEFTAATGSDCSRLLISGGGEFQQLPCRIEYQLAGSPRAAF